MPNARSVDVHLFGSGSIFFAVSRSRSLFADGGYTGWSMKRVYE
jgi:hypothetical protein